MLLATYSGGFKCAEADSPKYLLFERTIVGVFDPHTKPPIFDVIPDLVPSKMTDEYPVLSYDAPIHGTNYLTNCLENDEH